jgi:hypothetical protein
MHMEGGDLKFFAKIPWGRGQGFQEKLPGGFPTLGLIVFSKLSVLKFAWGVGAGGEESYTYHPPSPFVCIYGCRPLNFRPPSIK